jgi:hypothetical protein
MGNHFGEKVIVSGETYTLIGMSITYRDYYYILLNTDGSRVFSSCVGKLEFA